MLLQKHSKKAVGEKGVRNCVITPSLPAPFSGLVRENQGRLLHRSYQYSNGKKVFLIHLITHALIICLSQDLLFQGMLFYQTENFL